MTSPFMEFFAEALADQKYQVVRFEFPYMAKNRQSGTKKPPDREPVLRETWLDVINHFGAKDLIIGGKSMGGRMASLVADEAKVAGLVCLGYPFHPVGKPDRLRIDHLQNISTPTLIIQGTRDPFGNNKEVPNYPLGKKVQIVWVDDGDHSLKPRKSSGRTEEENLKEAAREIIDFVEEVTS